MVICTFNGLSSFYLYSYDTADLVLAQTLLGEAWRIGDVSRAYCVLALNVSKRHSFKYYTRFIIYLAHLFNFNTKMDMLIINPPDNNKRKNKAPPIHP